MENSAQPAAGSEKYTFILFISGMSVKSGHAIENLRHICDKHLAGNYTLEIIDISSNKQKAVDYQIIAIPTLIKTGPEESRKILGDLSDTGKVLRILDIKP